MKVEVTRRLASLCVRIPTLAFFMFFAGCQIAPSDPGKIERIRNSKDLPQLALTPQAFVVKGGNSLNLHYRATPLVSELRSVDLYFAENGDDFIFLASLITGEADYSWSVPSAIDRNTARFRLKAVNQVGNKSEIVSDPIAIDSSAPVVSLTSLNGGQTLISGVDQLLTWTATDPHLPASPIDLEYSTDSGSSWTLVNGGSSIANSGSFIWTAPATFSTHYRVRVRATDSVGNTAQSASSSDFIVQSIGAAPVATLNSASISNSLSATITTASCSAGGAWASILVTESTTLPTAGQSGWAPCVTTAGAYSISLGGTGTRSIRVYGKTSGGAVSGGYATLTVIVDQTNPNVSLTSLTGGGTYAGGSAQNVTWTATDANISGTPIKLEVSSNSGTSWTTISGATALANSGSFSYTLPSVNSSTYRVRVTATDDAGNSASSASASEFSIDSSAPTITSVTPPTDGTYLENEHLDFTVNFSEAVDVSGTRLALTIGSATRYATYQSGTGSNAVVYRYTTVSADTDTDGILVASPLQLNSGTIKDLVGNAVNPLTFSTPTTTGILVGYQPFTASWPFTAGTTASYTFDSTKIDFSGGVCRLTPSDQLDDDNACSGFGDGMTSNCGGSYSGAQWDSSL
ncbi:MAG: hypothetical protein EOP09_04970, partial [Proteobacteria bacterium]